MCAIDSLINLPRRLIYETRVYPHVLMLPDFGSMERTMDRAGCKAESCNPFTSKIDSISQLWPPANYEAEVKPEVCEETGNRVLGLLVVDYKDPINTQIQFFTASLPTLQLSGFERFKCFQIYSSLLWIDLLIPIPFSSWPSTPIAQRVIILFRWNVDRIIRPS